MAHYSEATVRVFERALEGLKTQLDDERLQAVRSLVKSGSLGDLKRLEEVLRQGGPRDGD